MGGKSRAWRYAIAIAALVSGMTVTVAGQASGQTSRNIAPELDLVQRTDVRGDRAVPNHGATTIPYFSDSVELAGKQYRYFMVGTNPKAAAATTVVPTVIIPLRLQFDTGESLDASASAVATVASPIFQTSHFTSGDTQFGDAMQRAMFWGSVANTDYHVRLQPTLAPTQTILVPKSRAVLLHPGDEIGTRHHHVGVLMALLNDRWFGDVVDRLAQTVDPRALPIVLTQDAVVGEGLKG